MFKLRRRYEDEDRRHQDNECRIIDDGHRLYMRPTYFEKKNQKKQKKHEWPRL